MQKTLKEAIKLRGLWSIKKFASKEAFERGEAYDEHIIGENLLLNEGINELWTLVAGTGGTKFDESNAYLGVGDSATGASAAQTGLQAVTNKAYVAVDAGFPTYGTAQKATWQATFDGSTANHAWNEFTVANGNSDAADNLNRLVEAEGTKTSGQVWQLTLEITIS